MRINLMKQYNEVKEDSKNTEDIMVMTALMEMESILLVMTDIGNVTVYDRFMANYHLVKAYNRTEEGKYNV